MKKLQLLALILILLLNLSSFATIAAGFNFDIQMDIDALEQETIAVMRSVQQTVSA
jgi:hypothetical protein